MEDSSFAGEFGIYTIDGRLEIRRCTFTADKALTNEGDGSIRVENSTFSGNAKYAINTNGSPGAFVLDSVTVSGASSGYVGFAGGTTIVNSLFHGNSTNVSIIGGSLTSLGYNFVSPISGFTAIGTDLTTGDPLLQALTDNGGATQTMALGVGSPAIDAVTSGGLDADQRGTARPQGSAADIGAFEVVP